MGTIDASLLTSWFNAKAGIPDTSAGSSGSSSSAQPAPTPPWSVTTSTSSSSSTSSTTPSGSSLALANLSLIASLNSGGKLIDATSAKLDAPGSDPKMASNYKALFGLYQGLSSLQSLAQELSDPKLSSFDAKQASQALQTGVGQVQSYLAGSPFSGFGVYASAAMTADTSTTVVPKESDSYVTKPLFAGPMNSEIPAFQGDVQFSLTAKKYSGALVTVDFDFSDLGSQPRTFANVLSYMNGKMAAAGLETRFANVFTPGTPKTVQAGNTTVTVGQNPDQFSLKVVGSSVETVSFAAPTTAPAVYLAGTSGITTGDKPDAVQQLMKLDAGSPPTDPSAAANGQVYKQALPTGVTSVDATATAPDGSVYVLAQVAGTVGNETVNGSADVALIKYDSAGNVMFTRTLGAATSATGLGLAVSADGSQVAVVGTTSDQLNPTSTTTAPAKSAAPQGFLTVYNGDGEEQWTQQTGSIGGTGTGVKPAGVAFGDGGMVYVAGQVDGTIAGATSSGASDGYVQAFHAVSKPLNDGSGLSQWVVSPTKAIQFGTSGQDRATGVAVNGGAIYVSGVEGGHAVVRRFDQSGSTIAATSSRDLGEVQGGNVAGVAVNADGSVIVAGSTHNGALDAGAVTTAYAGGEEAFVASLSGDLQAASSDRLTYLGGATDQGATAVTVSNGKVYVAGQISTTPPAGTGQTTAFDAYVAALDPTTGQVGFTQRYQGLDRQLVPAGISVAQTGSSVLDQLGLPTTLDYTPSQQLTANSSLRPGDSFQIRNGGSGLARTVTISADDTYATLATKIQRASGFTLTATVTKGTAGTTLKLTPSSSTQPATLVAGPDGYDALSALGLREGVVTSAATNLIQRANPKNSGAGAATNQLKNGYNLQLPSHFDLGTPAGVQAAMTALDNAISLVKGIYVDMKTPPSATASSSSSSGTVPAYLTNEIANYQAALQRLTGSTS